MIAAVHVNWFRLSALITCWTEETETVEEEMFRTVNSYTHNHDHWEERAGQWRLAGRFRAAAYAQRYAALGHSFENSCNTFPGK